MGFSGFPAAAIEFYEQLGADNSRTFWNEHKATFDGAVKGPMIELCEELAEYGPFSLFRPHNDLRFAKGRPPYKTQQGAYAESEGGTGYYLQISATGLMCGAGYYAMAKDQLERFREAVDRDHTGAEIAAICAAVKRAGNAGRGDRRTEVGTAWLPTGPSTRRTAAPQGADDVQGLRCAGVDPHQAGGHQGP